MNARDRREKQDTSWCIGSLKRLSCEDKLPDSFREKYLLEKPVDHYQVEKFCSDAKRREELEKIRRNPAKARRDSETDWE